MKKNLFISETIQDMAIVTVARHAYENSCSINQMMPFSMTLNKP